MPEKKGSQKCEEEIAIDFLSTVLCVSRSIVASWNLAIDFFVLYIVGIRVEKEPMEKA